MNGQNDNYYDSLEYLRAKYLGKGIIDASRLNTPQAQNKQPENPQTDSRDIAQTVNACGNPAQVDPVADNAVQVAPAAVCDDLEQLRNKYLKKGKSVRVSDNLNKVDLICNILLLVVVFLVEITAFIWFITPVTTFGGEKFSGSTLNIYSFLYGSENSMFNQIKNGIESFKNISAEPDEAISFATKFVRYGVLSFFTVMITILMVVEIISAPIYFAKKNSGNLSNVAVSSVTRKLLMNIAIVYCGSVSGGTGTDAYSYGYRTGIGMTVGMFIGLAVIIAVCVLRYLQKRGSAPQEEKRMLRRFVVTAAAYTALAVTFSCLRVYTVLVYSLTSFATAGAGIAANGFKIQALIFPVLNILILYSCKIVMDKTYNGIRTSFTYLLNFGENHLENLQRKQLKKIRRAEWRNLILIIVFSILSCLSVLVLKIPQLGYGWSVNIYPYMIATFAISAVAAVCNGIIFKYKPTAGTAV